MRKSYIIHIEGPNDRVCGVVIEASDEGQARRIFAAHREFAGFRVTAVSEVQHT